MKTGKDKTVLAQPVRPEVDLNLTATVRALLVEVGLGKYRHTLCMLPCHSPLV